MRGNLITDARSFTGVTGAKSVAYTYDLADRVSQVTYPSGRQVLYTRDTSGRISQVQSRKISTDPWTTIVSGIGYRPLSRLVEAMSYGNGLAYSATFTNDYEIGTCKVQDGATNVQSWSYTRADNLNITAITDNVTAANTLSLWYSPANRLQNANGPWGQKTFYHDGVGNRTQEITTVGTTTTTDTLGYPATNNKIVSVTRGASTIRQFVHDGAGNITSDTRSGVAYTYTYNKNNRLATVTNAGTLRGTYTYNGLQQLIKRVITNQGTQNGTVLMVHDRSGNVIAELTSAGATVREYIWLPEAEISPTMASRAQVDMPIAVVDGVNAILLACLLHDAGDVVGAHRPPQPSDEDDHRGPRNGVGNRTHKIPTVLSRWLSADEMASEAP